MGNSLRVGSVSSSFLGSHLSSYDTALYIIGHTVYIYLNEQMGE